MVVEQFVGADAIASVGGSSGMVINLVVGLFVGLSSAAYLRIYFAGIIFVFLYNVGSAVLRALGDSRRPLYYLIVCCFINIFLDVILVTFFRLGVAGVAIATVTAQAGSAAKHQEQPARFPGF